MPAIACNPSVIEPLSSVTVMAAASQTNSPSPQPTSRVVYQAQTPDIIKTAPLPAAVIDITAMNTPPQPPAQPAVLLPDISKMSTDLISSGQLLGDIPISEEQPVNAVLGSLQPGADPSTAPETTIHNAIQLAKSPITTDTMARSGSWSWGSEMVKPIILGLSVLTVVVALASIWFTSRENANSLNAPLNADNPRVFQPDTVPAATLVE